MRGYGPSFIREITTMTLYRKCFYTLTTVTLCAVSLWYTITHHLSSSDSLHTQVNAPQAPRKSQPVQGTNPFALADSSEANAISVLADNNDEITDFFDQANIIPAGVNSESSDCSLQCKQTIEILKLPYRIADDEFEKLHAQALQLAVYLQSNSQMLDEFIDIAVQADGNKRKIIIAAFAQLTESDRLALGQALIDSPSAHHRLDGIHLLTGTESMSELWVDEFSELLSNEQNGYVRQSVVQALNRPEIFEGDAKVLTMLSQVIQSDGDASVRGEALLVSARLTHDPQPLLYDSFSAIRSEQSVDQQYGVRAMAEIFDRHTRSGGQISEYDRNQLEQLVIDLMEPKFDNIAADVRSNIEDLYERFH